MLINVNKNLLYIEHTLQPVVLILFHILLSIDINQFANKVTYFSKHF